MRPGERPPNPFTNHGQTTTWDEPKSMMDKAGDAAAAVNDKAKEMASSVSQKAKEFGENVSEKAEAGFHLAQAKGQDFLEDAQRMIRRNPVPALLISFGVGVLLARFLEGSRR